jgi:hypothetical protein
MPSRETLESSETCMCMWLARSPGGCVSPQVVCGDESFESLKPTVQPQGQH